MQKCLDYAMKYIYRFPKSEKELTTQLLKKWFSELEIAWAMDFLKKKGYVDDKNYVEMYLNSEVIKKWKPMQLIVRKLLQKWVDKKLIYSVCDELEADIQDWISAKIEKEIERLKATGLDWFDVLQKLTQKGYKLSDIKKVINARQD